MEAESRAEAEAAASLLCGPEQSQTGRSLTPLLSFANKPSSFHRSLTWTGLTSESTMGRQAHLPHYRDGELRAPCLLGVLTPLKNILFLGESQSAECV